MPMTKLKDALQGATDAIHNAMGKRRNSPALCQWGIHDIPQTAIATVTVQRPCGHDHQEAPTCAKHLHTLTEVQGGSAVNAVPCSECGEVNTSQVVNVQMEG